MQKHFINKMGYCLQGRLALEQVGPPGANGDEARHVGDVDAEALHDCSGGGVNAGKEGA